MTHKLIKTDNYLLVVDDSEIKKGDYWHYVGELDNPILNYLPSTWYDNLHDRNKYKKVIAHLPLNGLPILEGVPLLPPYSRHQEDGLDDAVMSFKESWIKLGVTDYELSAFSEGYNKAREKYKYTEEDVIRIVEKSRETGLTAEYLMLSSQYPTEFVSEDEISHEGNGTYSTDLMDIGVSNLKPIKVPKTIITIQGRQWKGEYK